MWFAKISYSRLPFLPHTARHAMIVKDPARDYSQEGGKAPPDVDTTFAVTPIQLLYGNIAIYTVSDGGCGLIQRKFGGKIYALRSEGAPLVDDLQLVLVPKRTALYRWLLSRTTTTTTTTTTTSREGQQQQQFYYHHDDSGKRVVGHYYEEQIAAFLLLGPGLVHDDEYWEGDEGHSPEEQEEGHGERHERDSSVYHDDNDAMRTEDDPGVEGDDKKRQLVTFDDILASY